MGLLNILSIEICYSKQAYSVTMTDDSVHWTHYRDYCVMDECLLTWLDDVHNYARIIIYFHHYMVSTNGYIFSWVLHRILYIICTVQTVICIELYTYNLDTHSYACIIIHYMS